MEKDKTNDQRSPIPAKQRGGGLQIRGRRSRGPSSSTITTGNIPFPNFPSGELQPFIILGRSDEMRLSCGIRTIENWKDFNIPPIIQRLNEQISAARGRSLSRGRGAPGMFDKS